RVGSKDQHAHHRSRSLLLLSSGSGRLVRVLRSRSQRSASTRRNSWRRSASPGLERSSSRKSRSASARSDVEEAQPEARVYLVRRLRRGKRKEEHTSELQSRAKH